MAFQLSPGVSIREKDLTLIIPAVATTAGAFTGAFAWGPSNLRTLVTSEEELVAAFGQPADDLAYGASTGIVGNSVDFHTASEFLGYGNNLQVVRTLGDGANNANSAGTTTGVLVENEEDYDGTTFTSSFGNFVAKYAGDLGNSLMVSVCDAFGGSTAGTRVYRIVGATSAVGDFSDVPTVNPQTAIAGASVGVSSQSTSVSEANTGFKLLSKAQLSDSEFEFYVQGTGSAFDTGFDAIATGTDMYLHFGSDSVFRVAKDSSGNFEAYESSSGDLDEGTAYNVWKYRDQFDSVPEESVFAAGLNSQNDEMHIAIIDKDGLWSGTRGTVLERFPFVSKATDAKKSDGTSNYYKDVLRENSAYIWGGDLTFATDAGAVDFDDATQDKNFDSIGVRDFTLSGGDLGAMPTAAQIVSSMNTNFASSEDVDIQLLIGNGASSEADAKTIADAAIAIAEARKDCIAFVSPSLTDANGSTPLDDIISFRNTLPSSSYAVIGSAWKQRFDNYNDVQRWIPLTGDIAGLCVRTDRQADSWFSPAGFNRGQLRNVVKLSWNPSQTQRDRLYAKGINPVVTFPGRGTVLFGDKTMLSRPSAFDRINVRRLFIVLEKAIATASQYFLFELNNDSTRFLFRSTVEPFLRDVQGRGGLQDFYVVADTTNNTPTVIDNNEFRASIFLKPSRSISFISLDFVATPSGVSFSEVTG